MDLFKGGALVAFIIGFWDKIKSVLWMFISVIIQKAEIKTEDTHNEVVGYLIQNFKRNQTYDKVYGSQYESFRDGKYGLVPYEIFGHNLIIFYTKKKFFFKLFSLPFIFSKSSVAFLSNEAANGQNDSDKTYSYIISIRKTLNVADIVEKAISHRNNLTWNISEEEELANRFNIYYFPEREHRGNERHHGYNGYSWYRQNQYKLLGVTHDQLGRELKNSGNAIENLFFPTEIKDLIKIIRLWVKSKDWYKEKNIPWKRGWLLYGQPGTGKTALARAFAEDLDLPIYFFSLAQMSNNDLITAWQSMQLNVPCIALIEDIDNVFDKRKNIAQNRAFFLPSIDQTNEQGEKESNNEIKTPLTFDTLLNCIDGVDKSDGIFTIITTNDIEKIDEAIGKPVINGNGVKEFISTRPGRVDKVIELTFMNNENKLKMAEKILSDFPEKLTEVNVHINKNIEETPAQFQEYCAQIAIQEYWSQKELNVKKRD